MSTEIDYERQFMEIDEEKWLAVGAEFDNCRVFMANKPNAARTAWRFAARTENTGTDVALAKFCGAYYVWSAA